MHGLLQTCHKQIMALALGSCPPAISLQVGLAACMQCGDPLLQKRLQVIEQLAGGNLKRLVTEGRRWGRSLCCLKHEVSALALDCYITT